MTLLDRMLVYFASVAQRRYFVAIVAILVFRIAVNGLGTVPREPYRLTALGPFNRVQAYPENYFQRSPLLPLLGHFTGLTSQLGFAVLSLVIAIAAMLFFSLSARKRLGARDGLLLSGLVIAHPVTLILLSWLGTPDGLSVLFTTALLFAKSVPLVGIISALGAFNHPVLNIVAPVVIGLRLFGREPTINIQHLVAALIGLVVGNAGVFAFLSFFEIDTFTRLDFLMSRNLLTWVKQNLFALPHTLYSMHQAIWFVVALCSISLYKHDRTYLKAFVGSQLIAYLVTFFSADTTRVFSLLAWAPAVHCVKHTLAVQDRLGTGLELRRSAIAVFLIGLISPGYYIWSGEFHLPSFSEFYSSIFRTIRDFLTAGA